MREHLGKQPKAHGGAEPHLPRLRAVLDAAQANAKSMQDEFVSTEHLAWPARGAGEGGHRLKRQGARRDARSLSRRWHRSAAVSVTDQNPKAA
jgi:hypothetical protein